MRWISKKYNDTKERLMYKLWAKPFSPKNHRLGQNN